MLVRSKLNSIEKIISKAIIDAEINHEEFTVVSKEAKKYHRLKDRIRRKYSQQGDIGRDRLIKYDKRIRANEIHKQNKNRSLKLKTEV